VNTTRSDPPTPPSPSTRARRSGESRSGWRARRSGASGDGSAENGGVRSSGCARKRGSPPPGPRTTHCWARRKAGGGARPERWEPSPPLAQSRRGGRREGAGGGRRSARRQATYERGDACRRGAGARRGDGWGCSGGHTGGGNNVRASPLGKGNEGFPP
jgi:hypothetical protein